jgi:hypothetical protein
MDNYAYERNYTQKIIMVENKLLDVQKIQSHLNAIKAMAQTMLSEAEKVEAMLEAKPSKKKIDIDTERAIVELEYEKRFQRRLKKPDQ